MSTNTSIYNKSHPYQAAITKRYSLCKPGSLKSTYHVVLDLKGSGLTYDVGDSIAVFPVNDAHVVERTIHSIKADGSELVKDKHSEDNVPFCEYLTKKCNLVEVPRKLIAEIAKRQTNTSKKEYLDHLLSEGQKEKLKEYQAWHEVWDALAENEEAKFTAQELSQLLMPLLPRFYSIASSLAAVGEEVHLTVAELTYETNGITRRGVCTHYLCQLAPMGEKSVPIYIQPSNGFTLPQEGSSPVIMIGPGTGIAPFRAFLQERHAKGATGSNWLFFGEWHRHSEFYYEQDWQEYIQAGLLRLETAFSRDQEHKIYVQHRLMEHGQELFEWLEKGAYIYVCGDARRMAKDVDATLHQIVQNHAKCDEIAAKDYIKKLRSTKRYLRDVY